MWITVIPSVRNPFIWFLQKRYINKGWQKRDLQMKNTWKANEPQQQKPGWIILSSFFDDKKLWALLILVFHFTFMLIDDAFGLNIRLTFPRLPSLTVCTCVVVDLIFVCIFASPLSLVTMELVFSLSRCMLKRFLSLLSKKLTSFCHHHLSYTVHLIHITYITCLFRFVQKKMQWRFIGMQWIHRGFP